MHKSVIRRELARLKKEAHKSIFLIDEIPPDNHWADLPNDVRVCFSRAVVGNEGETMNHLLVLAKWGRVNDIIIKELLRMLGATGAVKESTAQSHCIIRHFWWS